MFAVSPVRMLALASLLALAACTPARDPATPSPAPTASAEQRLSAPRAEQRPFTVRSPQGDREDPWYWLRDDERQDPQVLAYLEAENAWFETWETRHASQVESLYQEMVGRLQQDDATVPVFDRGYWYYTRYEAGKQYPMVARKRGHLDAPEEVLLDGNAMAEGLEYFDLGDYAVSDDGRLLAWTEDTVGRRQYVLRVRDLHTGELVVPGIDRVSSFAWAADNQSLLYVENHPVTLLSYRVRRHVLGDATEDPVVYEEPDASFYTHVSRTRSGAYLVIGLYSTEAYEMRILEAASPGGEFQVFAPREREHLYAIDHVGDRWLVLTNRDAPNYRLMSVAVGKENDPAAWADLLPHSEEVFLEEVQAFDAFIAVGERFEGLLRVRILPRDGEAYHVPVDDPASTTRLGHNPSVNTTRLRYRYTSLATPGSVYELEAQSGQRVLLKRDPVLGEFDPENYVTERRWAPARDGALVPVSLVYRKGFARDSSAPLYLYAYGSYGLSQDPSFSSARLSLLDRGFVFAIAHVRGGQELGRHWYDEGRLLHKQNTFNDFIDVTQFLVSEGYAAPGKVFAAGASAGGLVMGAIANMAPELYAGIIAHVPFVDVVSTMLDESIPLTTNEFDEWGNPKLAPWYETMLAYSPYDNVRAQEYPPMFVTTGLHDSQVQYWEPAKWVAKLRATRTNDAPLVFKTTLEAGHAGRSGRFEELRETAQEYAFILDLAGLEN
jgi:oligopeptidase B